MTDPVGPAVAYDPYEAAGRDDETSLWSRLQASCPVHHHVRANPPAGPYPYAGGGTAHPTPEFWTLSRHRDVAAALHDPDRFRSGGGPVADRLEFPDGGMLVYADRPDHTAQRRIVSRAFLPRRVTALGPRIETLARDLVDAMAPAGRADLVAAFAAPLPMQVIAELVGIPPVDRDLFRSWSDTTVAGFDARDADVAARAAQVFRDYRDYLLDMIATRRVALATGKDVPDDLVSVLVDADYEGRCFTDDEIVRAVQQLVVAGNETTRAAIAFGVDLVSRHDLARAALCAGDASAIAAVVEEVLRLEPPIRGLFRTTSEPVSVDGVEIPAGAKVHLLYAAANRDGDEWGDPSSLRLDRDPVEARRHLTFGGGPHACIGASLARLELQVALPMLFQRLPGLRLDADAGPPLPLHHLTHRGWALLPVRWDL